MLCKTIWMTFQNTLLLGAGPSGVAPATYCALSRTTLGHLDPYFIQIMDQVKAGLRTLMQTSHEVTVPMSGTGSLGMEAAFVNTVEPGDKVLVLENGVFGNRMADVAERLGAQVTKEELYLGHSGPGGTGQGAAGAGFLQNRRGRPCGRPLRVCAIRWRRSASWSIRAGRSTWWTR